MEDQFCSSPFFAFTHYETNRHLLSHVSGMMYYATIDLQQQGHARGTRNCDIKSQGELFSFKVI